MSTIHLHDLDESQAAIDDAARRQWQTMAREYMSSHTSGDLSELIDELDRDLDRYADFWSIAHATVLA